MARSTVISPGHPLRQRHRTPFSLEFLITLTVRIRSFRHDRGRGLSLFCCGFPDSAGPGFQPAYLREAILATQYSSKVSPACFNWVIMKILEALFKTKKLQSRGGGRAT